MTKKTETKNNELAKRLVSILERLNNGERLQVEALAEEFQTSLRTIQRDLNHRFDFLTFETSMIWDEAKGKNVRVYALDPLYLGKFSYNEIKRFATLAGLNGLFPTLDANFLRELLVDRLPTLDIHGAALEDIQHRKNEFTRLQTAIGSRRLVRFSYQKDGTGSKQVEVAPYRLINHSGVWYLAASDAGRIKAYSFSKIRALNLTETPFQPDPELQKVLDSEDSIWLNQKKTDVVLSVAPPAAPYFQRRKLIAKQVIEKTLEDGSLLVTGNFAHPNQILPIVRYWLPHVRIVSPKAWQKELEDGLKDYLKQERKA
jgi:predicted DNA-binding transcriptional regulator YafY